MQYVVTGACGFIGAAVADLLLAGGHKVIAVDDLNDAYDVRLKEHRLERLRSQPAFEFNRLDIKDVSSFHDLFQHAQHAGDVAAGLHLAARTGVRSSVDQPALYFNTNTLGTLNLLEMCREYGVRKFLLASTSSVYGNQRAA